ncbi:alcohol acetyltransferase [Brachybacterium paraconglomeratum]|uniref:alcohol acetyltransferase n=1 Tax=Brachybacterium paraconglomeratum TaxID=173362 RepID=UPI0031E9BF52
MSRPVRRRHWVRLDNASNIFPATRSDRDPKVFRMSAELDHEVDPALLQEALEETFERFPLYHAVLRRGVFWYYLQDSDLHPVVEEETLPSCAAIYQPDRRTLLFRVVHHRRRISLEIFHALSDGTGALWFLTDLLAGYSRRRFPEEVPPRPAAEVEARPGAAERPDPPLAAVGTHPGAQAAEEVHELTTDSFAHYFRRRRRPLDPEQDAHQEEFSREAAPAVLTVQEADEPLPEEEPVAPADPAAPGPARRRIHRVRGTRTPDHRTRIIELTMPARPVLGLAKAEGVALTMYLTALFFEAIRRSEAGEPDARRAHGAPTMAASVPVNLRQFFPSTSARNFFATIRVEHTYGHGDDSPGAVARGLQEHFSAEATPEALEQKLQKLIRVERMALARIVPRPVKDRLLSVINYANNRRLTVAISNLGRVTLPEPAESHVGRMLFHVSAVRPQFCAISHDGQLTLSFTAPFVQTAHVREYAALLTEAGIEVTVSAARVSEDELLEFGT